MKKFLSLALLAAILPALTACVVEPVGVRSPFYVEHPRDDYYDRGYYDNRAERCNPRGCW